MNNPYLFASWPQRFASQTLVLLHYLRLLLLPHPLAADYSYNQLPYTDFSNPVVWVSLLAYIALIVMAFRFVSRRHPLGFAIAVYLLPLFLVSNLLFNIGAPMGERLIFHSSVGFAIVVAWLLVKAAGQIKNGAVSGGALIGIMGILIVLSGFKTIDRNKEWKNDETLFLTDVNTVPNSVLVNNNAAAACMSNAKKNREDVAVRNEWFSKAIAYFDKAIGIYPQHMMAHMNRGLCYFNMGFPDKALPDWDTVRKYKPNDPELAKYMVSAAGYFYNKGVTYGKANRNDSAIYAFTKCTELDPKKPEPWYYLAQALLAAGHPAEAKTAVDRALQIAPAYPAAQKLNQDLTRSGKPD